MLSSRESTMQGKWKNNLDNIELQNDSGRIVSIYYAKSVNSLAGGNDGEDSFLMMKEHNGLLQHQHPTIHSARTYRLMVVSELTDKSFIILSFI
jgi:hypothetical protein